MVPATDFAAIARLPAPGDNVAIATRTIDPGTVVNVSGTEYTLAHTILEGHRFAVQSIPEGDQLLSWGLPFGRALRDINPGDYICNQSTLDALRLRQTGAKLPSAPNFADELKPFALDVATFRPGVPTDVSPSREHFLAIVGLDHAGLGRGTI